MFDSIEDFFMHLLAVIFIALLAVGLYLLIAYAVSDKEFNGYYLHDGGAPTISIYINWDNAPDEAAMRFMDRDKALEVYRDLCKIDSARIK